MNERALTVEEVRRGLGERADSRGYRKFTKEAAATAVTFALARIKAGASAAEIADELGLKDWTLQRWLQWHRRGNGNRDGGFHRVEVKAPPARTVVLRGACGVSVEGLSVDELARLLRELSCSA